MGRKSQLEEAWQQIKEYFETSETKAFTEQDLNEVIATHRRAWKISPHHTASAFISFLIKKQEIRTHDFILLNTDKVKYIYTWQEQNLLSIIAALKNGSYFTHSTALNINKIDNSVFNDIYLNFEHSSVTTSSADSLMSQSGIDSAFSKPQRVSQLTYYYNGHHIHLLNGKKTNWLGVKSAPKKKGSYFYTDIERTLIDIVVRPDYAGGVEKVLDAYQSVKAKCDIEKLHSYLKNMNFHYPYHQAIGFYLEMAGYEEKHLQKFDEEKNYKFYVAYDIKDKSYSDRWKIFYPSKLQHFKNQ